MIVSLLISETSYYKHAINKVMRNLRMSHKGTKPMRKEMTINARDIILSIFSTETDAEKL